MKDYFKEIPDLLRKYSIDFEYIMKDTFGFSRHISIKINSLDYIIMIYKNICALYIGGIYKNQLWFDDIKYTTSNPDSMSGLTFIKNKEDIFHLTIQPLEWQMKYIFQESEGGELSRV